MEAALDRPRRSAWSIAAWPTRLAFLGLAGLFLARALHLGPHPDRLGFLQIGDGLLGRWPFESLAIDTYPPPFAVAMAPLAALARVLPDPAIRWLWGLCQLACLAWLTLACLRIFALPRSLGLVAVGWLCGWRPIVGDLNSQNVTLFLCALVVAALERDARGDRLRAGALLGLGAALKVWPILALPALMRRSQWPKALAGAAAGGLGAVAVAVAAYGPRAALEAFRFWIVRVIPQAGGAELQNQAFRGLVLRFLGPIPAARLVQAALGALCLGAALAMVLSRPATSARVRALDGLLLVLAGTPALPLAWYFYYLPVAPVAMAVAGSTAELRPMARRSALWLLSLGTLLGGFIDVDVVGRRLWSAGAACGNSLFGALLVTAAGFVVREAWRAADAPPRSLAG